MNILHIISTLEIGGVELQLLEILKRLDSSKYNSTVCCLTRSGPLLDEFLKLRIDIKVLKRRFRFDPSLICQIIRLLKEKKIDIVHTYMFTGNSWGTLASRIASVPVIINSVWDIEIWKRCYYRWIDRILFPFVDAVITNSDASMDFIIKKSRLEVKKFVTIYSGVDISKFSPSPLNETNHKHPTIGTVARLDEPKKGLIYLIEAISLIKKDIPHCQLILAGDGPSRNILENMVRNKKLNENVKFLGFRRDIQNVLSQIDVFALPSLWEGLGNVLLEAMAMEKAVVATMTGGIPEIVIDGETGFLVSPGDSSALANAIVKLLKCYETRIQMGKAGRKRVKENFTIEKTVERLEKIYDELIKRKH